MRLRAPRGGVAGLVRGLGGGSRLGRRVQVVAVEAAATRGGWAEFEQQLRDHGRVLLAPGGLQRRAALGVYRARVGAARQQSRHRSAVAPARRRVQRAFPARRAAAARVAQGSPAPAAAAAAGLPAAAAARGRKKCALGALRVRAASQQQFGHVRVALVRADVERG